jgi:hypothetical protein
MSEKTGADSIAEAEDQRILSAMEGIEKAREMVNHPSHYNMGGPKGPDGTAKYEAIKVIEDWSLGFCLGNALKYILRAPHKGAEEQDLNKARWYLDRYIYSPDHPDRDGPEFSMTAEEVSSAWGLGDDLANAVHAIRRGNAKGALLLIDAHIISKAASERR